MRLDLLVALVRAASDEGLWVLRVRLDMGLVGLIGQILRTSCPPYFYCPVEYTLFGSATN